MRGVQYLHCQASLPTSCPAASRVVDSRYTNGDPHVYIVLTPLRILWPLEAGARYRLRKIRQWARPCAWTCLIEQSLCTICFIATSSGAVAAMVACTCQARPRPASPSAVFVQIAKVDRVFGCCTFNKVFLSTPGLVVRSIRLYREVLTPPLSLASS